MKRHVFARIVISFVCGLVALMWVYAFIFAPRESINKIKDTAWQKRSQQTCLVAENKRFALQDLTAMSPTDETALKKKAVIVDLATDSVEIAINTIAKDIPTDVKGKAIVPDWIKEYRLYIQNRRQFADALRTATRRPFFSENEIEGVPVSERLGKFARENEMKACQPPLDLSV